ncbi:MAG: CbiX/SirB N-terminal domain-containing protein [Propionibacteriaceae bacterium]|nr:CbiX/SirB N-terminal domain-containing protein [Propionibacteriaceae bacterium]
MPAPALVLVARGSVDHRVNATMHTFRKRLQIMRPDLSVNLAFLDHCPPSGPQVVNALVGRGIREIAFVPTSLTAAIDGAGMEDLVQRVQAAHPGLRAQASRPIGPAPELLTLVDESLREALRQTRATQIDGLVLATGGPSDARGRALLNRRARQWAAHHRLPCQVALNDVPGQATRAAVASMRSRGRRHIAVGSLWLAADESYLAHAHAAHQAGALAVGRPIELSDGLLNLALARYAYAAMALLDFGSTAESALAL